MFTIFLTALAAVVSVLLVVLLAKPRHDAAPMHLPFGGLTVGAAALALTALGVWLL